MVNIDKLNKTIEDLEIRSKEISGVLEKHKEIQRIAAELDILKEKIDIESKTIIEDSTEINNLINKSKSSLLEVDNIINSSFDSLNNKLETFVNGACESLDNGQKDILKEIELQNKKIDEARKSFESIEQNIKTFNSDIVKKLNDIIAENYKAINEFQNVLESKTGILKSDLTLEIRNLDKRQSDLIENKVSRINEEVQSLKNSIEKNNQDNIELLEKNFKTQKVMMIMTIIVALVAVGTNFIK